MLKISQTTTKTKEPFGPLVDHCHQLGVEADVDYSMESVIPYFSESFETAGSMCGISAVDFAAAVVSRADEVVVLVNSAGVVGVGVDDVVHFFIPFRSF